jgi:HEPN domain-containing protein
MAEDYAAAARRHFRDAEKLAKCGRYDSAGHLIGFAAECAVKYCVENLRPAEATPHLHFPQLIEKAKKMLRGRKTHSLFTLLSQQNYMSGWEIGHRYSADSVSAETYETWRVRIALISTTKILLRLTTLG